jgi:hypothetical protein
MAGFAFVGYSWTENHILSLQPHAWPAQYQSQSLVFRDPAIIPRLGVWAFGAPPLMATIVVWQARRATKLGMRLDAGAVRLLAGVAMGGLLAMMACAAWYAPWLDDAAAGALTGAFGLPYVMVAALGVAVQLGCWRRLWRLGSICTRSLGLTSAAAAATVLSLCALREVIRLASLDDERIFAHVDRVAESGGLLAFLGFFALNAALIAYCVWIVSKRLAVERE